MNGLNGLRVEVSHALSGAKKSFRMGGTLYVSPELFEAMRSAKNSDELKALLEPVGVVEIPDVRLGAADYVLPMTTKFEPPTFNEIHSRMLADVGVRAAIPQHIFVGTRHIAADLKDVVTAEEIAVADQRRPGGE